MIISTITDAAGGTEDARRTSDLQDRRDTDPHRGKNANELAANHGHGCQQELFPPLIRFAQDWIAVIEGIEKLRQLEGVLGKISRFSGCDALAHDVRGFSGRQPELPYIVGGFAVKEAGKILRRDAACRVSSRPRIARRHRNAARGVSTETLRIQSTFAKNIGSAHDRILRVRARITLETQGVFKIECDHRLFRELQHEVAQCSDGDLRGNAGALRFAQLGMTRIHFLASRRDQSIEEIVRLPTEALSPRNLDPRSSLVFFAESVAKFSSAARSERDHLVGEVRVAIGGFSVAESA